MFGMQIKLGGNWVFIVPTNGEPYQYPTPEKAAEMLVTCYLDQLRELRLGGELCVRVRKFEEGE